MAETGLEDFVQAGYGITDSTLSRVGTVMENHKTYWDGKGIGVTCHKSAPLSTLY